MIKKKKILWLTGQPGSGKTTLSNEIVKIISKDEKKKDIQTIQVDGDDLRDLTDNKDYYARISLPIAFVWAKSFTRDLPQKP